MQANLILQQAVTHLTQENAVDLHILGKLQ